MKLGYGYRVVGFWTVWMLLLFTLLYFIPRDSQIRAAFSEADKESRASLPVRVDLAESGIRQVRLEVKDLQVRAGQIETRLSRLEQRMAKVEAKVDELLKMVSGLKAGMRAMRDRQTAEPKQPAPLPKKLPAAPAPTLKPGRTALEESDSSLYRNSRVYPIQESPKD